MLRKTKIALADRASGLPPTFASAQQTPDTKGNVTRLNEITVSSTRIKRSVDNTVTVTTAVKIEQDGAAHGERPGGTSDWLGPPTPKAAKKHTSARIVPGVRVMDESSTGILPNIGVPNLNPLRIEVAE